jgi:hypothetical protein
VLQVDGYDGFKRLALDRADSSVTLAFCWAHIMSETRHYAPGSDGGAIHWAIAMTLIQTAKLNGVNPMAYLADVLERIVSGRTKQNGLHTLLPWNWTASASATVSSQAA